MDIIIGTFQSYMGTGLTIILFLLALVYLFIFEKNKPRRILFVYTPVIILLLFFNPLFAWVFGRVEGGETYFRLFWLLPYLAVLSYTAVLIAERQKGKKVLCVAAAAAVLFAVSGKLVYTNPLYSRAENIYHMPDSVVHICDAIEIPGREVRAVFPHELLLYVRQYSPVVRLPYGREVLMDTLHEMYGTMEADEIDLEKLLSLSRKEECHYIVFRQDAEFIGEPADYQLELFLESDGYMVYRDNAVPLVIPETN